jgi:hypothetical protein
MYLVFLIALCLYKVYLIYMYIVIHYMYICVSTGIFLSKRLYRLIAVNGIVMQGVHV